jgi:LmbE family N-acetylglucosaminyl deacetylase
MPPLENLCGRAASWAVVVAHADDETLGAGGLLQRLKDPTIIELTDSAPREKRWWGAPEMESREAYRDARRAELRAALALAGIGAERVREVGFTDQEASLELAEAARRVRDLLAELRPELVLTHAYEGGHPDHDAAAFATHAACRLLAAEGGAAPRIVEFALYRTAADGSVMRCDFVPVEGIEAERVALSPEEQAKKRRMIDCFATQRETLSWLGADIAVECFRRAPAYDFARAAHEGAPHYERYGWGEMTGTRWRALAREALGELGLEP